MPTHKKKEGKERNKKLAKYGIMSKIAQQKKKKIEKKKSTKKTKQKHKQISKQINKN